MILSFHPCFTADFQIILGARSLDPEDILIINKADAVILPQGYSYEMYLACKERCKNIFPNYDSRYEYPGKTGQIRLFKKMYLPHPKSFLWESVQEFRRALKEREIYPPEKSFFIKSDKGHEGSGIYPVKDYDSLEIALGRLSLLEKSGSGEFITQELVPSRGNVLRVVIMGKNLISYWKRPKKKNGLVTTISRGAEIDKDWREDLQKKGRYLAGKLSSVSGINLAAVDMVFPLEMPDPSPLLLEINYYFGRRGLGGSMKYYGLLFETIREWLSEKGLDPDGINII